MQVFSNQCPRLVKKCYFIIPYEGLDHYPRVSKQKKMEFDSLVLSPPPSLSIGVGILFLFLRAAHVQCCSLLVHCRYIVTQCFTTVFEMFLRNLQHADQKSRDATRTNLLFRVQSPVSHTCQTQCACLDGLPTVLESKYLENKISCILVATLASITGWWFGTFFMFPYIGNSKPN